jgi:hypothetical protein
VKPGSRHFIGPLTPAQQRRRERNRATFRTVSLMADARGYTVSFVFKHLTEFRMNPRVFQFLDSLDA